MEREHGSPEGRSIPPEELRRLEVAVKAARLFGAKGKASTGQLLLSNGVQWIRMRKWELPEVGSELAERWMDELRRFRTRYADQLP